MSNKYSKLAIILSILILALDLSSTLNYMEFSYGLLPFLCLMLIDCLENFKISKLIYLISGVIVLLLFGARSPLLFLILLLIYWVITTLSKRRGIIVSFVISISIFFLLININLIFEFLSGINSKMNSYVLSNLLSGDFFSSNSRLLIYEESREMIKSMGFSMYGLFGDRLLLTGVYSHNIIYEFLISFGWFFGISMLLVMLFIILKAYFTSDRNGKLLIVAFTFALFARYFVSGSFVMEQMFYIYVAILIAFISGNKKKRIV
ncbi:hypothetical protein [Exiguobacterium sp. s151]|uniref:hypothetical protein n=1 Tax=Exiguobacterium sp. s151 TaxID=2751229 RepID=UPI001BEC38A1|nr:hypothetical protein [Exiguobacterium sp. s151]